MTLQTRVARIYPPLPHIIYYIYIRRRASYTTHSRRNFNSRSARQAVAYFILSSSLSLSPNDSFNDPSFSAPADNSYSPDLIIIAPLLPPTSPPPSPHLAHIYRLFISPGVRSSSSSSLSHLDVAAQHALLYTHFFFISTSSLFKQSILHKSWLLLYYIYVYAPIAAKSFHIIDFSFN